MTGIDAPEESRAPHPSAERHADAQTVMRTTESNDAGGGRGANASSAPTPRDVEAEREPVAPTREFSAFVEELDFDTPREDAPTRAKSDEVRAGRRRAPDASFDPAKTTPIGRPAETVGMNDAASAEAEDGRGRVARVSEGARVRAGQIREDTRVVFEESPDDGGLWFIVVAVALFLLFLLFLFLSTNVLR